MSKPRVLLVDDEDRLRLTLTKMLASEGLEVTAMAGGRQALAELAARPYDVVLLDIRMPEMDGITTLREIKKLGCDVEVIVLTGHASLDAALEIIQLGAYDYLMKPCPLEEMLLKIDAAFEKKLERGKSASPQPAGSRATDI
jgi:DNA-binding NtrC family response regulator